MCLLKILLYLSLLCFLSLSGYVAFEYQGSSGESWSFKAGLDLDVVAEESDL